MAKTYLDIVKYMVTAKFGIEGLVDKPDIIGAVFGQTEGLLGDELDLRELQKSGKIGRIEIDVSQSGSKTYGKLFLPASLDRVETCILAAAVESVDRVGPFEAQFQVEKVEDTRAEKRRHILDRAKMLMKQLLATEIPDSKELSELVQSEVKSSEIVEFGQDHLPAGPDIAKNNEVIFVEGRADVINLLRNNITNSIAIGGATANVPKTIIGLAAEKEVTVFVDGDRGGDLVIRSLLSVLDVDFVAKAPDGKEVEELARKEVIKALRSKVPIEQYLGAERNKYNHGQDRRDRRDHHHQQQYERQQQPRPEPAQQNDEMFEQVDKPYIKDLRNEEEEQHEGLQKIESSPVSSYSGAAGAQAKPVLESALLGQLANGLVELSGSLRSRVYSPDGNVIKEVPIRELLTTLQDMSGAYALVLDGVITQRLVELSLEKGIKAIYGIRANPMPRRHPELILYTKEQGKLE
ncbi:MAG: DNA primase DnaG [Candidatus Marsarchaeota archaeon]|nr:DNA primase DnaG [Candidatus Marsarchaeota archaeon]